MDAQMWAAAATQARLGGGDLLRELDDPLLAAAELRLQILKGPGLLLEVLLEPRQLPGEGGFLLSRLPDLLALVTQLVLDLFESFPALLRLGGFRLARSEGRASHHESDGRRGAHHEDGDQTQGLGPHPRNHRTTERPNACFQQDHAPDDSGAQEAAH